MDKQNIIFSNNLNHILLSRHLSQKEVAEAIEVSPQTFNTWCQGIALPRMGKLQKLADYFHINKSDLIEEHSDNEKSEHDPKVVAKAMDFYKRYESLPPEMQKEFQDYLAFLQSKSAPPQ